MISKSKSVLEDKKNLLNYMKISIIIPTYNERDNLKVLINSLTDTLGKDLKYEIIVVDDNSPDGTGVIADELSNNSKNIFVLHRPKKMGLTSALIDGFKISKGEFIGVLDADLQHSPELFEKFLERIEHGADLVIASRYIKGGKCEGWSTIRKIVSRGATSLAHMFLPNSRKIMDPLSGYFIVKKNQLNGIKLKGIGWKILLELIVNCKFNKIEEIPYCFRKRNGGDSKLGVHCYIDFCKLLFALRNDEKNSSISQSCDN